MIPKGSSLKTSFTKSGVNRSAAQFESHKWTAGEE